MTLLLFGIAIEAYGAPGNCLQYPVFVEGNDCLWFVDTYDAQPQCMNPAEEYFWAAPDLPAPEPCGACNLLRVTAVQVKGDEKANAAARSPRLPNKVKLRDQFKDKVPVNLNAPQHGGWHPKTGTTVVITQWVRIQTDGGEAIPVKLYVVKLDYKKGGHEVPPPARYLYVGFEAEVLPPDVSAPLIRRPLPWDNKKQPTRYACKIKFDDGESEADFTVVTNTPVFNQPEPRP